MKVLSVTSGGMDSMSMAVKSIHDGHEVALFHGDLQQKAEYPERYAVIECAKFLGIPFKMVDISWLGKMGGSCLTDEKIEPPKGLDSLRESLFIAEGAKEKHKEGKGLWTPARNVVLLSAAAAVAERYGYDMLTIGANQSETAYPDNRMEFLNRFEHMLEYGSLKRIQVGAPLYHLDKVGILEWSAKHGYGEIYEYTWSCDLGKSYQCGECGCCMNRRLAFYILSKLRPGLLADGQEYVNEEYFQETFLPAIREHGLVERFWFGKYRKYFLD